MRRVLPACLLVALAGCSAATRRTEVCCAAPPAPPPSGGVVFVADGSGDYRTLSANLSRAAAEAGVPVRVEVFAWSHGRGRYLADHLGHANHRAQGQRLAAQVAAYRRAYPGRPAQLVGFSAGCAVVLAAAEALPPGAVDRVVLLAPSVCVAYDLRPALRAARCGIDSFSSEEDRIVLGLGVGIVGTADRACRTAAGQCGFVPVIAGPADAALYANLREHSWSPAIRWTGHDGGHYGCTQIRFLGAYVLPLLARHPS